METSQTSTAGTAPERTQPPWQTLVLVCFKCKGARHGPDARDIRKGLKHRLGKSKHLRIIESECMDVCPDDAVTVCISRAARPQAGDDGSVSVELVRSERELDQLAHVLKQP